MKHFLSICFFVFFSNVCFGQSLTDSSLYFNTNVERIEKEIRIKQDSIVELKESQAKYLFRKESDKLDSQNQLWITAEYNCDVRENLNPNSKLLGTLNANDSAKVLSYSSSWWKVAFNGKTGYVVDHLILQNYQTEVYKIKKDSLKPEFEKKQALTDSIEQSPTKEGYSIRMISGKHKYGGSTKIEYKSLSQILSETEKKAEKQMWTSEDLQSTLETYKRLYKGGQIRLDIERTTIGAANTEWFSIIIKDLAENELYRVDLDSKIPETPNSNDYWWNLSIQGIDKRIKPPFYVYVVDRLEDAPFKFEVTSIKE